MHVRLRFAVVCVVGRGQKPWEIKLLLIQYPSLDLVVGFSPVFLMLPLYLLGVSSVRFISRRQVAMPMLMRVPEDSWVSTI